MKTLYKFVGNEDAVKAIAEGSLKFTKIEELNDPTELVPIMNKEAVSDSLASIRRTGYSDEQFKWLGYQEAILRLLSPETRVIPRPATVELANQTLALPIFDDMDYMERQVLRTIKLIRSRVGVLSLTERFDSLPMWAHYAAQAKGFVVRFQDLDEEFPGDKTGSLNAVKPVHYVQDILGLTHDPSTQDNLFFSKFLDWQYEREWRVVSALSSCQTRQYKTKKIHVRPIVRSRVTGVICGWNVQEEVVRRLISDLREINPDVEVLMASLSRGRIVLRGKA